MFSEIIVSLIAVVAAMWTFAQLLLPSRKWSSDAVLNGKTVVITGGNTGIGLETVRDLASRGARVIIGCRDTEKGYAAIGEMGESAAKIQIKKLDLASFASIKQFAAETLDEEPKIHYLINNAGLAACPYWLTEDGYEMQFGVNHLGHYLLTMLLVERLKESVPARIVNVSSMAHYMSEINFDNINCEKSYNSIKAYQRSKLANVLFTKELAERLQGTGVTTYSLHPGAIHTNLYRYTDKSMGRSIQWIYQHVSRIFFKSAKEGAQTTLYCVLDEQIANESGQYYSGCRKTIPSRMARSDTAAKKLWEISEEFTKAFLN